MNSELTCSACTFINEKGAKICKTCGKTLNLPAINFTCLGSPCSQCTFINSQNAVKCEICDSALTSLSKIHNQSVQFVQMTPDCQICVSPMRDLFEMPGCSHNFCKSCALQHFTTKISNYGVNTFRCPIDVCDYFDEVDKTNFFNDLKPLLKHILGEEIYGTFIRKISILNIIDKPGFIRCPLCNHCFQVSYLKSNSKMINCSGCEDTFCVNCHSIWKKDHSLVGCKSVKDGSGDVFNSTNAFCPKCKFKYFLERGGCMHITCSQCSYEYCEFCFEKITGKGRSCGFANCTKQQSLHGHHPRNCMYYVQEMDHTKLEQLLQTKKVQYITNQSRTTSNCQIKVSHEVGDKWQESACAKRATKLYNNMCLLHYKWYLGELIRKNAIDVVDVMNNLECSCELKRNNVTIPNLQKEYKAEEDSNTSRLRELIRLHIPYKNMLQL